MNQAPILITTEQLEAQLDDRNLRMVDLSKAEHYAQGHIPGAIHLEYASLVDGNKPAPGQLPSAERLERLALDLGLHNTCYVVACDDEGNGRAARLMWTLYVLGHRNCSVLDGGMTAWRSEDRSLSTATIAVERTTIPIRTMDQTVIADREYILSHLGNEHIALLDARTPEEYTGTKQVSARSGHIPGAVNLNWLDTIDRDNHLRLKPRAVLEGMLVERNILPSQEVVTYCQTHHRSAHAWMVLKYLDYPAVRGYPGSWSEWGNDPDTPIQSLIKDK